MKLVAILILTTLSSLTFADDTAPSACTPKDIFQRKGFVYSQQVSYQCDCREVDRATQTAIDAALGDCYAAGYSTCTVTFSAVIANGVSITCQDLGNCSSVIDLEWGCSARAIVMGQGL